MLVLVELGAAMLRPAPGAARTALDVAVALSLAVVLGVACGLVSRALWRRGPATMAWVPLAALLAPQLLRPFDTDYAWDPVLSGALVLLAWALPRLGGALCLGVVVAVPVAVSFGLDRGAGTLPRSSAGTTAAPDILLITVDTLRADAGLALPEPASWRRYEQAVSAAPWTLPAMFGLFIGEPVRAHQGGLRAERGGGFTRAREPHAWLPSQLAAGGYECAAFCSNPYLGRAFGFDRGFHRFVHADAFREPFLVRGALERLIHQLGGPVSRLRRERDERIVAEAVGWLASPLGRPRFTWVHLLAPHEYQRDVAAPPPGWVPGTEDPQLRRQAYAANVRATEAPVAALLASVEPARTVVVVTADHGEQLGERGVFGHGLSLEDPELRVPLALRGPGIEPGAVPGQVASFDLPALLLALASGGTPGDDLPLRAEAPVGGLRHHGHSATFALRLAPEQGASGTTGTYHPERVVPVRSADEDPLRPDRQTRHALEALGYLD